MIFLTQVREHAAASMRRFLTVMLRRPPDVSVVPRMMELLEATGRAYYDGGAARGPPSSDASSSGRPDKSPRLRTAPAQFHIPGFTPLSQPTAALVAAFAAAPAAASAPALQEALVSLLSVDGQPALSEAHALKRGPQVEAYVAAAIAAAALAARQHMWPSAATAAAYRWLYEALLSKVITSRTVTGRVLCFLFLPENGTVEMKGDVDMVLLGTIWLRQCRTAACCRSAGTPFGRLGRPTRRSPQL